jgi:hypothetical protein
MNINFVAIIKRIIAEQGKNILANPAQLKGFVADYAARESKSERLAFGRCIEYGAYTELKNAQDAEARQRVKAAVAQRVHSNKGIDLALCNNALDVLEAALFGISSTPKYQTPQAIYSPSSSQPYQQQTRQYQPAVTCITDDPILTFNINNNYFHLTEANGKKISANNIFQKSGATPYVIGAVIGLATFGVLGAAAYGATANWQIRLQLFKTRICFTRLGTLQKPTESIFIININEITSVAKTKAFTIMDKTEISLGTTSFGNLVFSTPGNMRDITVNLLLDLTGLKNG